MKTKYIYKSDVGRIRGQFRPIVPIRVFHHGEYIFGCKNIDQTSTVLDGISNFVGGSDYEKWRVPLLNSSEYTVNTALGYVSLKTSLQTDQVLAVAYEYTYGGTTYQVGEFASDITDTNKPCL